MQSYRECPSCRALLTVEQLSTAGGACPYCGTKIIDDAESENPYAPPKAELGEAIPSREVPRDLGGKLAMAFGLLFGQLPLFAALVLTIWIPGHLLIEMVVANNPNAANPMELLRLNNLIELVFGPVYAGGIITALAARMEGEKISYVEAMKAGLHHWGRLFWARFVAGILVGLGLLALIVPGIILAIRFSLIDEVVVLEGTGARVSRQRSTELASGRGFQIFLAGTVALSMIIGVSFALGFALEKLEPLNNPFVAAACDSLIDVFSVVFICLLFLYYWEARQQELGREKQVVDVGLRDLDA
jgi:hypothetical protein